MTDVSVPVRPNSLAFVEDTSIKDPNLLASSPRNTQQRISGTGGEGRKPGGPTCCRFSAETFSRAAGGRYTSLPRGDLAASIFGRVQEKTETIFGDSITKIEQSPTLVHVIFENGPARDFDLVVGADGLHSRVRELAFGPKSQFENYLGYKVAAFEAPGYKPRDELTYAMYTEVGQQVSRFAMQGDRTMFLFLFEDESLDRGNEMCTPKKLFSGSALGVAGGSARRY